MQELSLKLDRGLQGEARVVLGQVPAQLCVPCSRCFPSSLWGLGGKTHIPLQWVGNSTMAASLLWQCPCYGSVLASMPRWLSSGVGGLC